MAFEDQFAETERIPLGLHNDAGEEYWIEVKTCLDHGAMDEANKHLHKVRGVMDEKGKTQAVVNPDSNSYRNERVFASIVDWNLDEKDGSIWQLAPDSAKRRNIRRLPDKVFRRLLDRVNELNADDPGERADFREEAAGSDAGDRDGSAESPEVPEGDDVVEEARNPWEATG